MVKKKASNNLISRRDILKFGLQGGLVASLSPYLSGYSNRPFGEKTNVIVIVMDTTRVDRLGCYGYSRQTSPNIDELAKDSLVYDRAIAPSSWTLPSHASLFTGKFASSHGARYDSKGPFALSDAIAGRSRYDLYRVRGLAKDELTLAMVLKQEGYATGAVVAAIWLKKIFGLNKGFEFYDDAGVETINSRLAKSVTASAIDWIDKTRQKKFFLFLNYFDAHAPYMPPEDFAKVFKPETFLRRGRPTRGSYNALYDAEILYVDHYIGQLLKKLKEYNLYDKTMIIVTADHGELLGEHNKYRHGYDLYQEEIHIPMLIKYPHGEVSPARTATRVQLVDIMPIILERLKIDVPDGCQGNFPPNLGHPIVSEVSPLPMEDVGGNWRAIYDGDFKFIWNSKGNHLLFNLKNDPGEKVNLFEQRQRADQMLSKLNRYMSNLPAPGPVAEQQQQLDEKTKNTLKSLGYVN
jgi:arylsulfatase A-like enzyme